MCVCVCVLCMCVFKLWLLENLVRKLNFWSSHLCSACVTNVQLSFSFLWNLALMTFRVVFIYAITCLISFIRKSVLSRVILPIEAASNSLESPEGCIPFTKCWKLAFPGLFSFFFLIMEMRKSVSGRWLTVLQSFWLLTYFSYLKTWVISL